MRRERRGAAASASSARRRERGSIGAGCASPVATARPAKRRPRACRRCKQPPAGGNTRLIAATLQACAATSSARAAASSATSRRRTAPSCARAAASPAAQRTAQPQPQRPPRRSRSETWRGRARARRRGGAPARRVDRGRAANTSPGRSLTRICDGGLNRLKGSLNVDQGRIEPTSVGRGAPPARRRPGAARGRRRDERSRRHEPGAPRHRRLPPARRTSPTRSSPGWPRRFRASAGLPPPSRQVRGPRGGKPRRPDDAAWHVTYIASKGEQHYIDYLRGIIEHGVRRSGRRSSSGKRAARASRRT
jgi:hypothetical protein